MNRTITASVRALGFAAMMLAGSAQGVIKHSFVTIDEGLNNLLYVNEYDSTRNWTVAIGRTSPRDMQLVGNNRILIGHSNGYTEYDLTTGAVKRELLSYNNVTSVRRQPNKQTIIAGVDYAGSKGIVMLRLDSNNVQIRKVVYPGTYVRLIRQTNTGTLLMACNDTIKEADTNGTVVKKTYIADVVKPSDKHMWKAVRLINGNTLCSTGYGAFMAEIDPQGAIVRKFGQAPQPVGVKPNFYATFQLLSNGNCVVTNWQGHDSGRYVPGEMLELLEFNSAGAIVWSWNKSGAISISSLQGVLVIDSLNTNLLHDERNGIMEPLYPTTSIVGHYPVRFQTENRAAQTGLGGSGSDRVLNLLGRKIKESGYMQNHASGLEIGPGNTLDRRIDSSRR